MIFIENFQYKIQSVCMWSGADLTDVSCGLRKWGVTAVYYFSYGGKNYGNLNCIMFCF